jgi:hypothetical protein
MIVYQSNHSAAGGFYRSTPILFVNVDSSTHKNLFFSAFSFSGGFSEGETPVPIPNTAVKPLCADGTARVGVWESRSLPGS